MERIILMYFVFALAFCSCDKIEIPEPAETASTEPIFGLEFDTNGSSINLSAGEECTVLETGFDLDNFGIYSFFGDLSKDVDCVSEVDLSSLKIELRDNQERYNLASINENGVTLGTYEYFDAHEKLNGYTIGLESTANARISNVTSSTGQDLLVDEYGIFNAFLTPDTEWIQFDFQDLGFNESSSIRIALRSNSILSLPVGVLSASIITPNTQDIVISAELAESFFSEDITYLWEDGSTENFISLTLDDFPLEKCVEISDQQGFLYSECIKINSLFTTLPFGLLWANFNSVPIFEFSQELRTVIVEYINEDGEVFTSVGNNQFSIFEILEIESFDPNPEGLLTDKLNVRFDCSLISPTSGQVIQIDNTEGVIAVSYPSN